MAEDKKYGGGKNVQSRGVGQAKATRSGQVQVNKGANTAGGKGSVKQKPGTYSYKKNVGVGSPDAREARNKIGYKNYVPGAASNANDDPYAWLKELMGGGGGGGGGRAYSDAQVGATEAKLRALYSRYAQDILDQQGNINANYAAGATNLGSIYDTAVGNVNKSYDAARAEQTRQLLALGMTEQTPTQSFGNQTGDVGSFERLRAAVLAQNEASRANAITNQRLASEAAQREGANQIAQTVAQMQSAMTSGGGGGGGGGGLSPYQYASLVMRQQENDMSNQQAAARLAASAPTAKAPVDVIGIYNDLVAGGTDPKVASSLAGSQARYMGS